MTAKRDRGEEWSAGEILRWSSAARCDNSVTADASTFASELLARAEETRRPFTIFTLSGIKDEASDVIGSAEGFDDLCREQKVRSPSRLSTCARAGGG